jgi:anti-anti-sigma regulatory factor
VLDGRVLLCVLPNRTPEDTDIQRLADLLLCSDDIQSVVIDLSQVNTVSSLFLARLLALNKRLQPIKGRLSVSGLSPIVREIFRRTHFDTLLDVLESQSSDPDTQNGGVELTRVMAFSIL